MRALVVDEEMRERAVKALDRAIKEDGFVVLDEQTRYQLASALVESAGLVLADDAIIDHRPPQRVFVSWCPGCGGVDYAYKGKPDRKKERPPDCPRCSIPSDDMVIAGPYRLLRKTKTP